MHVPFLSPFSLLPWTLHTFFVVVVQVTGAPCCDCAGNFAVFFALTLFTGFATV